MWAVHYRISLNTIEKEGKKEITNKGILMKLKVLLGPQCTFGNIPKMA